MSCSVTSRKTRSERFSLVSVVKSCGPSFAMHAWWMRVFISAYGSEEVSDFGASPIAALVESAMGCSLGDALLLLLLLAGAPLSPSLAGVPSHDAYASMFRWLAM